MSDFLFRLRWNIETSYYETKTFWSFRDYMVCSVKGIERLFNLTCITYAAVRLLPYYDKEFEAYKGRSPQEIRYQLGDKIRINIIIHSLGQAIETIKKDLPLKKAFHELMRKYGYLYKFVKCCRINQAFLILVPFYGINHAAFRIFKYLLIVDYCFIAENAFNGRFIKIKNLAILLGIVFLSLAAQTTVDGGIGDIFKLFERIDLGQLRTLF